jgi:putative transposase
MHAPQIGVSVPPRYNIAMVIGFLKGKSAIRIHRELMGYENKFEPDRHWVFKLTSKTQ